MVGRATSRDAEARADQRTLRSLLKRSDYATSDLEALEGPDRAREDRIIDQINDAMITTAGYPASRRQLVSADRAALSRWEEEGGSSCPSGKADDQMSDGSDDDDVR